MNTTNMFLDTQNVYIQAAGIRRILHGMYICNSYGLASIFLYNVNNNNIGLHLRQEQPNEINYISARYDCDIEFDYSLEAIGLNNSNYIELRNIHATMYIQYLNFFSELLINIIDEIYNRQQDEGNQIGTDLQAVYSFIHNQLPTTKSAISMLFDIRIYNNYLVLTI